MGKNQTPALQCQDCDYVAESAADLIDHRWCRMQEKVLRKATAPGTALQIAALSRAPLTQDEVEAVYGKAALDNTRRRLCQSHERLRAELEGAEQRIAELERELGEYQAFAEKARQAADDRRGAALAEADAQTPDCPHCGPACDLIASPGSSRRPKA